MKFLKRLFVSLFVIVLLAVVATFFLPSDVHVERDRVIESTPDVIYIQVADVKNWPAWMPWLKHDPNMKMEYSENTVGAGAWYSWTSDNPDVGSGKLTILEAEENKSLKTQIEFVGMGTSNGTWTFVEEGEGTKVTWGYDGDVSSPMVIGKFLGLFMDGMLGPDFESGLASIDSIVKLIPPAPAYTIEIVEETVESSPYLGVSDSCMILPDSFASAYGRCFGMIGGAIYAQGVNMAGMPFVIADRWAPETGWYWFTAAIPVDSAVAGTETVVGGMSYAGNVVRGVHVGPYDNLEASHHEIDKYMKDKGLTMTGNPWEQYVDDPTTVAPAELRTYIFYPVQ